MNQKRNLPPAHSLLVRTLLLTGGLGCFSSISLLSAGIALAQTPSLASSVPSAEDLLQEDLLQTDLPSSFQAPAVDAAIDAAPLVAPDPVIAAPETIAPEIESFSSEGANQETTSPAILPSPESAGVAPSESPDALVSPSLADDASKAFGSSGNYIDSTPYGLGATQKPDVVLSERSTGCQAVVSADQIAPASICPTATVGAEGSGLGNYDPSSLTVYNLQSGGTASARDFYNLTVRPPAQLSNGNVSLLFPLAIPAAISSAFGWRLHPVGGEMRFHSGTDLGAPQGTPVLAAFSGKVDIADLVGGYGLTIVLQHNKGAEQTLYAHLSEVFVKPGEEIKQGEVIGRVGSTGLSTGPHLHFEFRKLTPEGWVVMNPGSVLEKSLAQLVQSLKVAQVNPKLQLPAMFQVPGKALLQGVKPQNTAKTQSQPQAKIEAQPSQTLSPQASE